jgi:class 3 adenylate cyclase
MMDLERTIGRGAGRTPLAAILAADVSGYARLMDADELVSGFHCQN